jgi:pimeloyl-ACP methyl ester carboxylesterase
MSNAIARTLLNVLMLGGVLYAGLVLLVYVFQARLLYFPDVGRSVLATPLAVGLDYEDAWLDAGQNVRVHGWFVPRREAKGTILLLHGNAGSIALRLDWLKMFHELGYTTFIIDYRGYGRSSGTPSEQGTYDDALAAWRYLTTLKGVAPRDIVVVGDSLGGAIAAWLAARVDARALILQSTFTSVPDVAADVYQFLPVRLISRFGYNTLDYVKQIRAPILIAHSPHDEVIGYHHGRALFDAADAPKQFLELSGGHNDAYLFLRREWVDSLAAFLDAAITRADNVAGANRTTAPR